MNIDSIQWPDDAKEASRLYLGFVIHVVEGMAFSFGDSNHDPLATASAYLEHEISEEEYRSAATPWWDYLDSSGGIRETRDRAALTARLAICLLSATPREAERLGEHLSWFFEVLGFLGIDLAQPLREMEHYFRSCSHRSPNQGM